mmetsp:Transcript_12347/g.30255  ORF Transcript_12347/g.30255 Transcript_12347/m.30255 type:complete len:351 (-) Transcript_12347:295-1347(-)
MPAITNHCQHSSSVHAAVCAGAFKQLTQPAFHSQSQHHHHPLPSAPPKQASRGELTGAACSCLLLLAGLAEHNHLHGGEHAGLAASNQGLGDHDQHVVHLLHALGGQAQEVKEGNDGVVQVVHPGQGAQAVVPGASHHGGDGNVLAPHQLKAHRLARILSLLPGAHLRQTVAIVDLIHDAHVLGVLGVKLGGGHPLVGQEHGARLQHTEHLTIHHLQLGSVAGGLNGICTIEAVGLEGHVGEVSTHDSGQRSNALLGVVVSSTLHLVLVDGDPNNVRTRHGSNGAHRPTHTTADIQNLVPGLGTENRGNTGLMCSLRLLPVLARQLGGEVERLAPTPLVNVGDKGVEHIH